MSDQPAAHARQHATGKTRQATWVQRKPLTSGGGKGALECATSLRVDSESRMHVWQATRGMERDAHSLQESLLPQSIGRVRAGSQQQQSHCSS